MIRNYFLTAWRNLSKNKLNASINVLGLTVAFTCCVLLFLMTNFEFSYDGFQINAAHIFKVYTVSHTPNGDEKGTSMSYPVAPSIKTEVPGITGATSIMYAGMGIRYKAKEVDRMVTLVDNDFFGMFSFPILSGARTNPLAGIGDVVLSKATVEGLFGREDPIGKMVAVKIGDEWKNLLVSAVIADAPLNSSVRYYILARIEINGSYPQTKNDWTKQHHPVYVQTAPGVTQRQAEASLRSLVKRHHLADDEDLKSRGYRKDSNGDMFAMKLAPFTTLHFDEELGSGATISKAYLYTLVLIAIVIMVIACFNFINLNVARAFTRAKEVGIRKTIGAGKKQIFLQLWAESLLLCTIAVILALIVAVSVLQPFNNLFTEKLKTGAMGQPLFISAVIGGMLLVSFLAGGYPALLVSRFNPVQVLKGKLSVNSSAFLRNGLITFQFIMASLLICGTIVIYRQFQYMRTAPLGFEQESVISIPVKNFSNTRQYAQQLRLSLASQPQIVSVTGSSINIGIGEDHSQSDWNMGFSYNGKPIGTSLVTVDYDYLSTLGITPIAGRDFSREFTSDTSALVNNVVVTESMARQFGLKNVVGLSFYADSSEPKWNIVGIIPDFHLHSMHEKITPITLSMKKGIPLSYIMVKVKTTNPLQAMNLVRAAYKNIEPDNAVTPSYLTENTRRWYEKEQRLSTIFCTAAVLAILLSCLGLFAIVSLVMQQRRKEIGVRKVLGASIPQITGLLSKDFLKLVFLAFVIATPVAWYFLNKWLQNFVYRIDMSWWIFAVAGILACIIALVTISLQTIKASLANPVKSLRTE